MINSGIYLIKNVKNSKYYLGSAVNMFARKNKHFSDLNKNIHHSIILQRAYNKHGKENFKFEIVLFCDKKHLKLLEQQFLNNYDCYYNSSKTASGFEVGRKFSKELETRRIKGMLKPIIQYDLNMNFIREWESSKKAASELNIYNSHISECCNGKVKTAKGYIFKFKDNFIAYKKSSNAKYSKEERKRRKADASSSSYIIVFPCGKKEKITNLKQFCIDNDLNQSTMYNSYHKKRKTRNGYMVKKII